MTEDSNHHKVAHEMAKNKEDKICHDRRLPNPTHNEKMQHDKHEQNEADLFYDV
jgi:hypothetical protein